MAVVKSTYNLRKNLPNKIFTNKFLIFNATFNNLLKISTCTVLHNNVDNLVFLINETIMVLNYVFVM